ncbi:hypothetical protein PROFUN_05657 [Planoprotostelium fungivorum]|uniref:VTT domain-containing protein n=1 Tax=Planoprotostelium fungivorum TaxID=1890364 RepID=A0A2P6MUL7_9EUKA|nr:hypothetical protein PROFUN_05657 [Planoprotostelium fungivorum]
MEGLRKNLSILALLVLIFLSSLFLVYHNFPSLTVDQKSKLIRLPRSLSDVRDISSVLDLYTEDYYFIVIVGYSLAYLFLQTFSIPGSVFLSILAGAIFRFYVGFLLVCTLSTVGACNSFLVSKYLCRSLITQWFPQRISFLHDEVQKRKNNIFNYVLFLRFTPVVPNWFVNIASPIVGISLHLFALATFFGVMPQTFVAVRAGITLHQITSTGELFDWKIFVMLIVLSLVAVLPTLSPFKRLVAKYLDKKDKET